MSECTTYLVRILITYPEVIFLVRVTVTELELRLQWFGMCEFDNKADTSYQDVDIALRRQISGVIS